MGSEGKQVGSDEAGERRERKRTAMRDVSLDGTISDAARVFGVWEFCDHQELNAMRPAVLDGAIRPAFGVYLLRSYGTAVVVRVVGEETPSRLRAPYYYIEGRGAFRLLRREDWPALSDGDGSRILLTLGASAG